MNIGTYRSQTGNKLSRPSEDNSGKRSSRRSRSYWQYMLVVFLIVTSGSLPVFAGSENKQEPQDPLTDLEQAPETSAAADPCDLLIFEVSKFEISFRPQDHPGHPSLEELLNLEVELLRVEDGYAAPREGLPTVKIRLSDAGELPVNRFYASALFRVSQRIVEYINSLGIIVVYVPVCENDIEIYVDPVTQKTELTDLRTERQKKTARPATFTIYTGVVTGVRTVASGERIAKEKRIDNPRHERIKARSPIVPFDEETDERKDLVRKDMLDAYIFRLNRHPGRKVDIALSSAERAGEVALDYLITENKPWLVYAQMSNTGTEETDKWRERFGVMHNQVTGNDDIFTLDYITAGFDEAHSIIGSYDAPLFDLEGMRWRVFGTWGQFDASEVGFADEKFYSDEWSAGGELVKNIFQHDELFLDLFAGARWRSVSVENEISQLKGESDFFLPSAGLRLERFTGTARTFGQIEYEQNLPGMADTAKKGEELEALGRLYTDDDWSVLKWDFIHSFYLEPMLNRKAWKDIKTEKSSTLAHEMSVMFRGQYSFDHRLVPQAVGVAGGFYSVRGYPESLVNGDSTLIASAEYRFHLPRTFQIERQPGKLLGKAFRWAPQQLYSRPDWDLIFRTFIDFGRTDIVDREPSYENNQQLLGTGVGVELQFTRRINLRVDWGIALDEVQSGDENIKSGDSRIHFVGTVLF